mgnify:CR=1 FL=1
MEKEISRKNEIAQKYGIDFDSLEKEQVGMAKEISLKDRIDFSLAERYGGVETIFIGNKILCCIIVCDKEFEVIDKAYAFEKIKFPYVPGFRNYREMPAMTLAFEKLNEKPDVFFISGHGVTHPRFGLASHFSLASGIPAIGVANSIIGCKVEEKDGGDILKDEKKVGNVLIVKENSRPLFVSPGNLISVKSAYNISKGLVKLPHKRPEPMHLAGKYAKDVRRELG